MKLIDFAMELGAFVSFVHYIVHFKIGVQGKVKELIIIGIVLIIAVWLGERFLKRKLHITKKTNTMDDRAKSLQFFALAILMIGFVIGSIMGSVTLATKYENFNFVYFLGPYLILVSMVRGFMDWKFNQPSKQWILQIYTIFLLFILMIAIFLIDPLK